MDNNKLNAQLLRDTATAAGLLADKARYAPFEADLGPLRDEHAANLAQAGTLESAVMGETSADATQQKAGAKTQLKALAPRLAAALQAHAASKANTDDDLAGRVRYSRTDITQTDDASFATIIGTLLTEAAPLAAALAKREFSADDPPSPPPSSPASPANGSASAPSSWPVPPTAKPSSPCCAATPASSCKCACSSSPTRARPPNTTFGCAFRATPSSLFSARAGVRAKRRPRPWGREWVRRKKEPRQ